MHFGWFRILPQKCFDGRNLPKVAYGFKTIRRILTSFFPKWGGISSTDSVPGLRWTPPENSLDRKIAFDVFHEEFKKPYFFTVFVCLMKKYYVYVIDVIYDKFVEMKEWLKCEFDIDMGWQFWRGLDAACIFTAFDVVHKRLSGYFSSGKYED